MFLFSCMFSIIIKSYKSDLVQIIVNDVYKQVPRNTGIYVTEQIAMKVLYKIRYVNVKLNNFHKPFAILSHFLRNKSISFVWETNTLRISYG